MIITRHDEPTGVLLSYEAFDSLMETLDVMSDPEVVKDLLESLNDPNPTSISFEESILNTQEFLVNDLPKKNYGVQNKTTSKSRKKSS